MKRVALSILLLAQPAAAMTSSELGAARQWVVGIYDRLPQANFDWSKQNFDTGLRGLVRRDARFASASRSVGAIDGVPFCDCQDTAEDYRVTRSSARSLGSARAAITIWLRNNGNGRFVVDVVRESDGGFAIADIHSLATPSLLAFLRREIPAEERELRQPLRGR